MTLARAAAIAIVWPYLLLLAILGGFLFVLTAALATFILLVDLAIGAPTSDALTSWRAHIRETANDFLPGRW